MSTVGVPIELQERILDCLLGDISTLKTCSFVCRAWRPTTRTHLFRRFRALYDADTEPEDDPAFYRCRKYVQQVLHLAEYIREIDIQDEPGILLEDGVSESHALCVILDRIESLHRVSISTFGGGYSTMRAWRKISPKFRASLSATLHRSPWSLTHIFVDGFSFAVSDLDMFRGMRRLEYIGLERMGVEYDENETSFTPISDDSPRLGSLQTITLYFNFSDPENGLLVTGLVKALEVINVLHITNLRLGGVVNTAVFEALPSTWLSSITHLGLELTNLNPTHRSSPLSAASIAQVPAFQAVRDLELSLNIYPSAVPHDLSALEIFLEKLLPEHRLDSIITTVVAHGPAVYIDAVRRHYDFCLSRADVVKVQWEDGKPEILDVPFSEFFANKTMEVGKFRRGKWISW